MLKFVRTSSSACDGSKFWFMSVEFVVVKSWLGLTVLPLMIETETCEGFQYERNVPDVSVC